MSNQNNSNALVNKVSILAVISFLFAAHMSWSDSQLYSILKNPDFVESLGFFSKLFATLGGTITGTILGGVAYLIKGVLSRVTSEWQYTAIGWGIVIMGLIGGAGVGTREVLLWMI
ncbi:hypothetical protein [Haemophilus haemolyticus]|uniref:hypothetical protein n=1 Tax=Haemophilus haemolyticus TaxID=726 RepID=UPI000E5961BD|nr:hypothetical protein [Haemophilus haemolyticus]